MKTYKITIKHHIENAWGIVFFIVGSIVYPIYMINRFGTADEMVHIKTSFGIFLIFLIPQLLLHLNYYVVNKGDEFIYNELDGNLTFIHKGNTLTSNVNNISLVEQYRSFPFAEKRIEWFPWDGYNYSVINFEDGNFIVINSLLVPKLELKIEPEKVKLKKKFYCWSPPQQKV